MTQTDGDETTMNRLGDDDAGETGAVKSKIQSMKPSDQQIATHETFGYNPYRDWGPDALKRQREDQNSLPCVEHGLWVLH